MIKVWLRMFWVRRLESRRKRLLDRVSEIDGMIDRHLHKLKDDTEELAEQVKETGEKHGWLNQQ